MALRGLIWSRRLWPLNMAQATAAMNDNLVKNALLVLVLFRLHTGSTGLSALAGGLFIAPYILLSATAGVLADRYPKRQLAQVYKSAELLLSGVAALGFLSQNVPLLLGALVGFGIQAALFGPVKYAVLPEFLADAELLGGNAIVEATTFFSIITGTIAGGALMLLDQGPLIVSALSGSLSLLGWLAAGQIRSLPAADPALLPRINILAETCAVLIAACRIRPIRRSLLGISWFWTMGATVLTELPILTRDTMGASAAVLTLLLTVFAAGVGVGSMGCTRLLAGRTSSWLASYAALGMSLFCWDLGHAAQRATDLARIEALIGAYAGWRLMADLLLLAACGGGLSVPLYAIVQRSAPVAARSRMIAANNIMNALFMVVGAAATAALAGAGLSAPAVLMGAAAANMIVVIWLFLVRLEDDPAPTRP